MKYFNYLLLTMATLCCSNAIAVTYYVDALNGNDSKSGTTSAVSAANGPWQSIARVNTASLNPGDQVLFSCGQSWYETLKPSSNSTTAAQIYFGSYPLKCADKPKITGFRSISAYSWQPYQGNIWKAAFPQNLIINSDLSKSIANWTKWPSDASQTFNATCPQSVAGCMNFLAGTSVNTSLAISRWFPLIGGKKYALTASIFVPSGTSVKLIVREHGNSYRTLGLVKPIVGNDQWQNVNVEFTSTQTLPHARLDIEVPKTKQIYVSYATVQESGTLAKPSSVVFDGDPVTIAHHPNAGHDAAKPESIYLKTAAASPWFRDSENRKVNSKIIVPDLKLPVDGIIDAGTKLRLREANWRINDYTVSSLTNSDLSITPNTLYNLASAGWGFYFYDALWMLDSPGEWFFDETTQTMYLRTPTNENPGNKVSIATLDTAIDLRHKSNMTVENIEIEGATSGVLMSSSSNVTLQSLTIHDISGQAIFGWSSINPIISGNSISRVAMSSGLSALNVDSSTNAFIENNELSEVGVLVKAGKRISLPMVATSAIYSGMGSIIANNVLSGIGGFGIISGKDNDIDSNVVERACLNINDCGAIYASPKSLKTVIRNNLVLDVSGDMTGAPDSMWRLANGIYLDEGISGISVTGNTVKGGTNSIHLYKSGQNTISGNILYGAEGWLLRQQEERIASAKISGNIITKNQFFPTIDDVAISNSFYSYISPDASKFATYADNYYSTIYSPYIVRENNVSGLSNAYTLNEWQAAKNTAGQPRNNDLNSAAPSPLPSLTQGIIGKDFVLNSDFSTGLKGWSSWNATAPKASQILEGCLPVSVNCMHVTAGASDTMVSSPQFTITKGKFYRITFDLKTTSVNANLKSLVRVAGPTDYKPLMKVPYNITPSTDWKRHSFIFEATATANNPAIANQGARFDFVGLATNQDLWIANIEIVPYDSVLTRTDLLVNKTDVDKTVDCPTKLTDPGLCSQYHVFPEANVAVWPISVPPRSGRIVFTQKTTLHDSDNDGVADSQDNCAGTASGLAVNGKGCSLVD
ncbi:MAG: right-handed parallel beta-helix repeat-containing protein [Methylococcaceae bacterium]|nr:right-handed parallel beta-helix repeat-containing protein [Methylococcaceae bacterium]MDP3902517.1 right-handed parallel beta-helix repeat-containing protein [Methylococcaceae bacterium]